MFNNPIKQLHRKIDLVLKNQEIIMAAIDDLSAAETNLETVVGALVADIQTLSTELAAAQGSNDNAAVAAVAAKLNALAASAQAALPAAQANSPVAAP
jgi:hypothetical protein